jgi:hypothetical protein
MMRSTLLFMAVGARGRGRKKSPALEAGRSGAESFRSLSGSIERRNVLPSPRAGYSPHGLGQKKAPPFARRGRQ